jgi:hypothetical protein
VTRALSQFELVAPFPFAPFAVTVPAARHRSGRVAEGSTRMSGPGSQLEKDGYEGPLVKLRNGFRDSTGFHLVGLPGLSVRLLSTRRRLPRFGCVVALLRSGECGTSLSGGQETTRP